MTQKELIAKVAAETGITKRDTKMMLEAITKAISDELTNGGSIRLTELGTFSVTVIPERKVNNKLFGSTVCYPEQKRVKFKVAKGLKDRLNA